MHNQLGVNKQTRRPVGVNQRARSAAQLSALCAPKPPLPSDPLATFDYGCLRLSSFSHPLAYCRLYVLDSSANKQQVDLEIYLENS